MSGYLELARLVTFRPMQSPIPSQNRAAPFSAPWTSTVKLLARELRLHGARNAVMELDLRERDFRIDGMPRGDRRARSDGIVLSFEARAVPGKPHLRYEVATFREWQDNVRAIALSLESLRAVDRYGVTKRGEQYAGWKALTAGAGDGDASRGRSLIAKAGGLKKALQDAHPDHGGSPSDFRDVMAAKESEA